MDDRKTSALKPNPLFWILIIVALMLAIVGGVNHQRKLACLASPSVEKCGMVSPVPLITSELAETGLTPPPWDRGEWREERALISQVQTARAATIAAGVAVVSLLLTAIGVYLLRLTLSETSETLKEARRTTEAAEQNNELYRIASSANLNIEKLTAPNIANIRKTATVRGEITIKNGGETLASQVSVEAQAQLVALDNDDSIFDDSNWSEIAMVKFSPLRIDVNQHIGSKNEITGNLRFIFVDRSNIHFEKMKSLLVPTKKREFLLLYINIKIVFRYRTVFDAENEQFECWIGVIDHSKGNRDQLPIVRWRPARSFNDRPKPLDFIEFTPVEEWGRFKHRTEFS